MPSAKPYISKHPYRGLTAAIATMHGKELVIRPVLECWFGIQLRVAPGVDTDALGTFTGEMPRAGTMLDAARAKARLAIEKTGADLGIGTEGAFGPDPLVPFFASGRELIVLIEAATGHEIAVHRQTKTNFEHVVASPGDTFQEFLDRIGFPQHAVVVRPQPSNGTSPIFKGLTDNGAIAAAVEAVAARSIEGGAIVQTDMRAYLNPTRMAAIKLTARWLALRTARCCPRCQKPGFGLVEVDRGLPCSECGSPTRLIRAEIHGCRSCDCRLRKRERPGRLRSDPMWCDYCNP